MDTVTSELYEEFEDESTSSTAVNKPDLVAKFQFNYPPKAAEADEDGDLIVSRKSTGNEFGILEIEYSKSTGLDLVGLQIWRGALLLADWILHNSSSFSPDSCILELGAGVGFTSIIAAMYAPVCCTDVNRGNILKLIDSNCKRNYKLTKHPITIKEIDFTRPTFSDEINDILKNVSTVIAADVIYDNDLTEHFIRTMERILCVPPTKTIFVAIEKRFVFTIADCDTVAPCYDFLIDCLELSKTIKFELLPLDFPQYFRYDRIKHLRLLKITAK